MSKTLFGDRNLTGTPIFTRYFWLNFMVLLKSFRLPPPILEFLFFLLHEQQNAIHCMCHMKSTNTLYKMKNFIFVLQFMLIFVQTCLHCRGFAFPTAKVLYRYFMLQSCSLFYFPLFIYIYRIFNVLQVLLFYLRYIVLKYFDKRHRDKRINNEDHLFAI